jgi:hypothetical protein
MALESGSKPDRTIQYACKDRRIERQISAGSGISVKQRVFHKVRIKALAYQVMLFFA